jgi:hypothetical protein
MMEMKKIGIIFCLSVICAIKSFSQTVEKPNYALKSHQTLEISKVEITTLKTVVYMIIENRIEGGNFCADRNIFLIDPEGTKLKLLKSSGIPVCPDSYKFKEQGEKLSFSLEFPPLKPGTKWIDIIEDCASNCFWFYGVTLDNELNKRLDEVFLIASQKKASESIFLFKSILDSIDSQNLGIEGLLYINIISAAVEDTDKVNATVWYRRLAASNAPRVSQYLKYLNDSGIKY